MLVYQWCSLNSSSNFNREGPEVRTKQKLLLTIRLNCFISTRGKTLLFLQDLGTKLMNTIQAWV